MVLIIDMSGGEILRPSPVTLAEEASLKVFYQPDVTSRNLSDTLMLSQLDNAAEKLDMTEKRYWVEAIRALAIPVDFDRSGKVPIKNFFSLNFEGEFACYSKVVVGKIIGGASIKALCLTFHETLLLPFFDTLPDDHLLYIPVHAVEKIDKLESLDD